MLLPTRSKSKFLIAQAFISLCVPCVDLHNSEYYACLFCLDFRFHTGKVTPVVTDVSNFMEMLLNDCSRETFDIDSENPIHPEEMSFLVLKVQMIITYISLFHF